MYLFLSVIYHKSLCNGLFVLILLYVHSLNASVSLENSTAQVKRMVQPSAGADSLIQRSPEKCCNQDQWLLFSDSDQGATCNYLTPQIQSFVSNSSWLQSFSEFGTIYKSCGFSIKKYVWTESNAKNYSYFSENQTFFNLETKVYHAVICSDFVNLDDYYDSDDRNYSIDDFKSLEKNFTHHFICSFPDAKLVAKHEHEAFRIVLISYGLGFSNLCIFVTFYLYISTPRLRRKVYDKCFLCQIAAFFVAFSFTIWRRQQYFIDSNEHSAVYYSFIGFMNQYWLLAGYTWLTVLCVDLWCAIAARMSLQSVTRKLFFYNLSAWGFPFLMSIVTFCATQLEDNDLKVDFQEGAGWFKYINGSNIPFYRHPEFIFYFSYVTLTLLINTCLFIHISTTLMTNDCIWQKVKDSQKHEVNKNRFCMYSKLFLVMGLTWILDNLTYYIPCDNLNCMWWWTAADFLGSIIPGISIFITSVCNTRVLTLLKQQFLPGHKGYRQGSSVMSRRVNSTMSERSMSSKQSSISLKVATTQK